MPAAPTTEIDLSGFGLERLQHIGRGQYACAQLVRETATGATYVAKCISLAALNDHDQDMAHQEGLLLQTLTHPYVVGYRDSFLIEGANTLVIVMEHCDSGDLRQAIKAKVKNGEHFTEDQIMTWFVQLCLALQYIHSEKVLHRDLKTSNIFLTQGEDGTILPKLGDFGISRVFEGTTEAAVTIVGTPYYMSPEVCRSEPYNWKSDIWALGCVLYELCMLKHAFESSSLLGLVYKIVSDHYEPIPSFYSESLNGLIRQLLMKNAEQRPTINEIFGNDYVKSYLQNCKVPPAATPSVPEPPGGATIQKRAMPTLRPGGGAGVVRAPPAPPPPPPGPPVLDARSSVQIIASRIRRRLVGQKLNWISSCASFDESGEGVLSQEAMRSAITSMYLGLSDDEIASFAHSLADAAGKVSLDAFGGSIREVSPEVQQCETWARMILAPASKQLRDLLQASDASQIGTLAPPVFQAALKEAAPVVTPQQLDILVLMADKNFLGDVDYAEFINAFGAPLAPTLPPAPAGPGWSPAAGGAGPPLPARPAGMPPLPGGPSVGGAPRPPGMPPLPGASAPPSLGATEMDPLAMTLTVGNITFFTATSATASQMVGAGRTAASGAARSLSPEGCALVLSRMKRRLEVAGLPIADAVALFADSAGPGEREITAEEWLQAANVLPLGTSRAEMQQLFSKLDAAGTGRVTLSALEACFSRVSAAGCTSVPPWISSAMQRGLCVRLRDDLLRLSAPGGATLAQESDFRRVVMQSERYLTSDQLSCLLLLADKSASGHIDYVEFAERFGGVAGAAPPPPRVPGGVLPFPDDDSLLGQPPAPDEELRTVGARTGAVLERHSLGPERLPALLALWGQNRDAAVSAELLATLPLGLARREAAAQLQASGGDPAAFAGRLVELRAQGVWKGCCEWAASNIPGAALRTALQRQVIEAEMRTLDPADFIRALTEAGTAAGNLPSALWLAEKTGRGDVRVGDFLASFGGQQPAGAAAKKKRGMLFRIMGR